MRGFRRAFLSGEVTPAPNLLLAAAMAEARTVTDPAGNSKLAKGGSGRREHGRDDAAASRHSRGVPGSSTAGPADERKAPERDRMISCSLLSSSTSSCSLLSSSRP